MKHVTVTTHIPDLPIRAAIAESRLPQVLMMPRLAATEELIYRPMNFS